MLTCLHKLLAQNDHFNLWIKLHYKKSKSLVFPSSMKLSQITDLVPVGAH